jgi:uncharacterized protein YdaU (DUF1376 family)
VPEQRPSFPWYAKEWLTSTRGLSPAARGFYIDMLSLAWVNGGCEADADALRRSVGAEKAEWRRAWPELEPRWPVVDGRRLNTRLERVREEANAYAEAKRLAGQKGGRAKAERLADGKQTPSKAIAGDVANPSLASALAVSSSLRSEEISPTPRKQKPTDTPDFLRFWDAYPRHKAKGDARRAWAKLKPDTDLVDTILAALAWQRKQHDWTKDGGKWIPYPATWLNDEGWEDEHPDGALNGTLLDPPVGTPIGYWKPPSKPADGAR